MSELLPCPFCNSHNVRLAKCVAKYVVCNDCEAYGPTAGNDSDAIRRWNFRHTDPAQAQVTEAQIEAALDSYALGWRDNHPVYHRHCMREALEAAARARGTGMSEWQPIESAPKGEHPERPRYVLVSDGHYVFVGYRYEPSYPDDPEWCDESGDFIEPQPSHWMPLPEPPK